MVIVVFRPMVVAGAGVVVGTGLGGERCPQQHRGQAPVAQQPLEHRIGQQPQFTGENLQGHMAVAQVVSRLQQGQGVVGLQLQQLLLGRHHPHQRWPRRRGGETVDLELGIIFVGVSVEKHQLTFVDGTGAKVLRGY